MGIHIDFKWLHSMKTCSQLSNIKEVHSLLFRMWELRLPIRAHTQQIRGNLHNCENIPDVWQWYYDPTKQALQGTIHVSGSTEPVACERRNAQRKPVRVCETNNWISGFRLVVSKMARWEKENNRINPTGHGKRSKNVSEEKILQVSRAIRESCEPER